MGDGVEAMNSDLVQKDSLMHGLAGTLAEQEAASEAAETSITQLNSAVQKLKAENTQLRQASQSTNGELDGLRQQHKEHSDESLNLNAKLQLVEQREASMLQQLQLEMSTLVDEMATQHATHEALTVQVQSSRASEADTATALEEAQSELRAALTAHEIMHQRAMELEGALISQNHVCPAKSDLPVPPAGKRLAYEKKLNSLETQLDAARQRELNLKSSELRGANQVNKLQDQLRRTDEHRSRLLRATEFPEYRGTRLGSASPSRHGMRSTSPYRVLDGERQEAGSKRYLEQLRDRGAKRTSERR